MLNEAVRLVREAVWDMLAEDDPSSRVIAATILKQSGHSVVSVSTGAEALQTYLQDNGIIG